MMHQIHCCVTDYCKTATKQKLVISCVALFSRRRFAHKIGNHIKRAWSLCVRMMMHLKFGSDFGLTNRHRRRPSSFRLSAPSFVGGSYFFTAKRSPSTCRSEHR